MDLTNLGFTSWAGLAAIGAIIATVWRHIATFGRYLVGFIIGTSVFKDDAGEAAMAYTFSKSIKSPLGKRVFGGFESYVHPKRWSETIGYEGMSADPIIIKYGRQYALISLGGAALEKESQIGEYNNSGSVIRIRYIRLFFNIDKFICDAIEYYNNEKRQGKGIIDKVHKPVPRFKIVRCSAKASKEENGTSGLNSPQSSQPIAVSRSDIDRFIMTGVYKLLKWQREDLQMKPEDGNSPFTGYPFPIEVEIAIKELDCWLKNEKWFRSKSIPWRRGYLFYGKPGSGKSTLTRALGMSFNLPVYVFDLVGMTNNDLVHNWDDMMSNTPCIALIEDIDAIFKGRDYIGGGKLNSNHVTFDCLLNCISGVKSADGVFLVVTTNHIENLDPALGIPDITGKSSRPGRIDKAIHLDVMQESERRVLANHILSDFTELVENTIQLGEGETAAQFQSRCAQLALEKFWDKQNTT